MTKTTPHEVSRPYARGSGIPNPVDVHVGKRIRLRRLFLGMNQEAIGEKLGISFQQVQKYEKGDNRVSASRLSEIAGILGVPISYFFGELQADGGSPSAANDRSWHQHIDEPETIDLLRFYYAIPEKMRGQFLALIKAAAREK